MEKMEFEETPEDNESISDESEADSGIYMKPNFFIIKSHVNL
jgi:hypothetical protein